MLYKWFFGLNQSYTFGANFYIRLAANKPGNSCNNNEYCYNGRPYAMAYSIASTNGWNIDSTFVYWEGGSPGYSPAENDATGFSAIPAGLWDHVYEGAGKYAFFWSSTPYDSHMAWYCRLSDWSDGIRRYMDKKDYGFSVRCLRDK